MEKARAIRNGPDIGELEGHFCFMVAQGALLKNSFEVARSYYRKCIEIPYNGYSCLIGLARIELGRGNNSGVKVHLNSALELTGNSTAGLSDLAEIARKASYKELAISIYKKAARLSGKAYHEKFQLGSLYWDLGNLQAAWSWYEAALSDMPGCPYALYNLVQAGISLQNATLVQKYFEIQKKAAADPSHETLTGKAARFLAAHSFLKGNFGKASEYIEIAVEYLPERADIEKDAEFLKEVRSHGSQDFIPRAWGNAWSLEINKYRIKTCIPLTVVQAAWPRVWKEINKIAEFYGKTPRKLQLKGDIYLFKSENEYKSWCEKKHPKCMWAGGFYSPAKDLIVSYGRPEIAPERLVTVIVHEAAHQIIRRVWKEKLPIWFDEGMAQYFDTRVNVDEHWGYSNERLSNFAILATARHNGNAFSLKQLLWADYDEFYGEGRRERYYAQAWSFLEFMFEAGKLKCNRVQIKDFLRRYDNKYRQQKYLRWEEEWIKWEADRIKALGISATPRKVEKPPEDKKEKDK
ncbi:MAG: DUF1570 domain-containing protein [Planctomycetota bacterium]|nr:MAG: DUF1570 domain-containing protein [Planctomycetota bacterium]